jgi:hypothetical protein
MTWSKCVGMLELVGIRAVVVLVPASPFIALCWWMSKACPFCKMFIPRSATSCARCCADLPARTQTPP